ncbi:AI-2E family transporter [Niveispirillum irakense]|uniref:AI-2E family transporter n=1 Tax=Niveispirillum irakense TaxID=34011 RepID=UPI000426B108|nr:AI-2E family transporter [Niveispirillum irakense]
MNAARQWRFWLWTLIVFIGLVWLLRSVLGPFVAGMAIAYLLDPLVDRLERRGVARWAGTTIVLLGFALALILSLLLLVPLLQGQAMQLVQTIPSWVSWAREEALPYVQHLMEQLPQEDMDKLRGAVGDYAGTAVSWTADLLKGVVTQGVALVDIISVVLITPIVAFYLLRDWDQLIANMDSWLPRQHIGTIREQAKAVDNTLSGFVRGQATVCLVLGAFYAVALTAAGLKFGLIIGMVAGLLSFIPFVGSLVGFLASVGVALFQFDEMWRVAIVAGIFFFGQAVEGNVLTPKLVGDKVGLHPVWVIFALMAGGALFGFVGILLAVPMAAVIGVLVRFVLGQYMDSTIYRGPAPAAPTPCPEIAIDPLPADPAAEGTDRRILSDYRPAP